MSNETDKKEKATIRENDHTTSPSVPTSPSASIWDSRLWRVLIQFLVHMFCVVLYLIPVFAPNEHGGPTLDEMHIMSPDNHDIQGTSSLLQVFQNDYWGRPMQSESSHRSWRPLTVLSFRYLKGLYTASQLTTHRCVNILAHAAAAEVVGILASRLVAPSNPPRDSLLLRMITKIVFVLHPAHVEVTVNAANRNHILAVLCSASICDPRCSLWLFVAAIIAGYLCSETFLFQVPAAMITLVVLQYYTERRQKQQQKQSDKKTTTQIQLQNPTIWSVLSDYIFAAIHVSPRLVCMIISILLYLGGRAYFDTLNIPDGLIRPAENPFYHFEGDHRVRNYLYTLAIHIAKSTGFWDPIGFSHEYGFDCIPELQTWQDPRLSLPLGIGCLLLLSLMLAVRFPQTLLGPTAMQWGWLITLFPISGIVKVGTFVSDRIVVPLTVSVSLWIGIGLWFWITRGIHRWAFPPAPMQMIVVGWLLTMTCIKVHTRALQWMDPISLLESSLQTCPRFAKAHMELSKVHSGLYPDKFDLRMARYHLDIAQEIDPEMCDVHQQLAHVAIQEGNYLEYEKELTQAVLCPFTMGGAFPMWQRYWQVALNSATTALENERMEILQRQEKYKQIIQEAVKKAQEKEEATRMKKKESPSVAWGK